ncbi:MAG: hypothetical protein Q4C84_11320 [Bacillota bacterium]|nr:hypothetical protein [Bacillota bacterium]
MGRLRVLEGKFQQEKEEIEMEADVVYKIEDGKLVGNMVFC